MKKKHKKTNPTWGGRFTDPPTKIMEKINASISIDKRLWKEDIQGSQAHCKMLMTQNIIDQNSGELILNGLKQISDEIEKGLFLFKNEFEDIHMNIEHRLFEIIGETAGKLHTARSRNDQVATDLRLWVRDACDQLIDKITQFQNTLIESIKAHSNSIMPGFTHLQVAQPITLGMHLESYWFMMNRDKSRMTDCRKRLNESPLGACALSGTGFNINRNYTAHTLGFDHPIANTIDAVSARDFATEFLFAVAQCGLHLSRLAEEIIIWATPQFSFINLSDQWSTGSSIMPQKKNPDAAELIRAKTGRLNGNLIQLMTVMKALPMAYNKDMQEDKACVFESYDTLALCLDAINGMIKTATFNIDIMKKAAESGFATATEIADWLVRTLNIPFREAHHITGQIVKIAIKQNSQLDQLSLDDLQKIEPRITNDIFNSLNLEKAIEARRK